MTALPIFLRPSVLFRELDLTQRIGVILSTTGAIVGEFERGPIEPTYQDGSDENYRSLYGEIANTALGFAHDTYTTFATQSVDCLIKRVTKNALYAGTTVFYDSLNNRAFFVPFTTGTNDSYKEGLRATAIVGINGTFTTGNTFKLDITDGVTNTSTATTTYATSHNATLTQIAASIQTVLNTFGAGATAVVYNEPTGGNNKLIIIRVPKTLTLDFSGVVITGPTAVLDENPKLFDIYAENPGIWANDYGVRITEIDAGVRQRTTLTLAGPLITGNTINVVVNGVNISQVYTTSSDNTLALLATAIAASADVDTAIVTTVPSAVDNDRVITITAQKPGRLAADFYAVSVTGGSTQTAVILETQYNGIAADGSMTLQVYSRSNTNVTKETFRVSLNPQLDSRGYQQGIEQKVNLSSGKSINIRVIRPTGSTYTMYNSTTGDAIVVPSTISWMGGGTDGVRATSAEIRSGWRTIDDRVQWPFNVMLNAGYTSPSVQKEMITIAEERSDCTAILDAPTDKQAANDLRLYRLNDLDIDSSYGAMYSPDIQIEDIKTGERRFIPPSGPVGATYAYSDSLTSGIGAPAGLNRGKIPLAVGLRFKYTIAEQNLLFPQQMNLILDIPKIGPAVMGEETLQVAKSARSSVHVRRILNIIKTGLVDGLGFTLFEPNSENTRNNAIQLGRTLLDPMTDPKGNNALYGFKIKCDDDNNPPEVIDADQLAYDVYLKVVRVIKGVLVRGILTRTGANFEEIEV